MLKRSIKIIPFDFGGQCDQGVFLKDFNWFIQQKIKSKKLIKSKYNSSNSDDKYAHFHYSYLFVIMGWGF